ncbi:MULTISPECIES: hypothetical protein [Pseudoalteromonas]|uniref:Uncharacterized protein n=1 Tax=Pseudoalteromonas luteoviolacea (strain 2ta16) TaxID=1353533 RepID=V4JBP1_PSEL2|nr:MULTISPECIES: hypothetical protein [Pseudoalteromonas]ESP92542.1 hypothetical protein PL2TA16_04135 [Pseudoalteromonas luteoviolacea 2ta16]KZN32738.1 hypothetical protein N483_26925 [Pseudoalteromonas luteoviolacea NCIMB 1944]MCG7550563.1 hypothetical protein [Pseudoalteromonas sp. Of7M-16]
MLIDVLQISYLSSVVVVFLITVSLISIQQGLPKLQRLELALCWVMILSPAVEFMSLLDFEIPWLVVAFIHASPLLLGPLIERYRNETDSSYVAHWRSVIHFVPFVAFFTYRLFDSTEVTPAVGVLYLTQIIYYQISLIKVKGLFQSSVAPQNKTSSMLIPQKLLMSFYFLFSAAGVIQMAGYFFNFEQLWLLLHITNTFVFIYVVLLCRGYINLLLKKLESLNQSSY